MRIILKNKDTLLYDEFKFKCSIGKSGITSKKTEGDKKTPRGIYSLGSVFYRKDKIKNLETKLNKVVITKEMGWCDDPNNHKYNQLVIIKEKIKCEKLFRKDSKYDILIPIKFNSHKIKKGKGSAIFLHLTNNYNKTLGCISLKKKDMIILLKVIDKKTKFQIN